MYRRSSTADKACTQSVSKAMEAGLCLPSIESQPLASRYDIYEGYLSWYKQLICPLAALI